MNKLLLSLIVSLPLVFSSTPATSNSGWSLRVNVGGGSSSLLVGDSSAGYNVGLFPYYRVGYHDTHRHIRKYHHGKSHRHFHHRYHWGPKKDFGYHRYQKHHHYHDRYKRDNIYKYRHFYHQNPHHRYYSNCRYVKRYVYKNGHIYTVRKRVC